MTQLFFFYVHVRSGMKMRKQYCYFVIFNSIVQVMAVSIAYRNYEEAGTDDLVVIGGVFPVHSTVNGSCGPISLSTVQYVEAVSYVTQLVNSGQGPITLRGVKLGFEIHDTCGTVSIALQQSLQLIISKTPLKGYGVAGAVGESRSFVTIPITNLLQLFNIPLISYGATASVLSDKLQYPDFLRTVPPDNYQGKALADIVNYFNWTYVVAMSSSDVYGQKGIAVFINDFKNVSQGRCIANNPIEIPYPGATVADYDLAVNELAAPYVANATAVVLFAQLETVQGVLDAVQRRRERDAAFAVKQFVWVGTDAWTASLDVKRYTIAQNVLGVVPEALKSTGFDNYFQSLHISNHTDDPWFAEYWETYFRCSLNGTNPALPRCDVANQSISSATGFVTDTYLPHCIDAIYAIAYAIRDIQNAVCNGSGLCNATLSTSRSDVSVVDGQLLLQYLLRANFSSESGDQVSFDENGDPTSAVYTVKYLQGGAIITVGNWVSTLHPSLNISMPLVWNPTLTNGTPNSLCSEPCQYGQYRDVIPEQSSCCWHCKSCNGENPYSDGKVCMQCATGFKTNPTKDGCVPIQASYFSASNAWAAISITISCIGFIIVVIAGGVLASHFNNKLVRASSRELIAFLIAGILLCYLMPFFFIAKPSPAICAIRRFGVGFSFSTCFSPILVRTVRIHRIFNREPSTKPPKFVSSLSQVFFTVAIISVQVLILVIWLAVEHPTIKYVFDFNSGIIQCGENPYTGLSIALGYNAILLLITLLFAFLTRKVPENFNETRFINLTTYTLVIIWIAFIPIYFGTITLGPIFQTSSQLLATVLSASAILGGLILPKVYIILSNKWDDFHVTTTEANRNPSTENTFEISLKTINSNPAKRVSEDPVLTTSSFLNAQSHRKDASTQTD